MQSFTAGASLPVRHWCGNSHLRVIMGWLAPRVWDPGADSLGSRKREREERRYVLSTGGWVILSTPLTLSVLFPFLSPSLFRLSWLISSTILVFKYQLLSISVLLAVTLLILSFGPVCFSLSPVTLILTVEVSLRVSPSGCEIKQRTFWCVFVFGFIKPQSNVSLPGAKSQEAQINS